jgi:hypothetical protein
MTTVEQCRKIQRRIALDQKVLAVASVNLDVGDWAVYIGAVPGENHDQEWIEVWKHGTKLSRQIAEILFPEFKQFNWRY